MFKIKERGDEFVTAIREERRCDKSRGSDGGKEKEGEDVYETPKKIPVSIPSTEGLLGLATANTLLDLALSHEESDCEQIR